MSETKTVRITMNLPVNIELTVEPIHEGDDFDVKDVSVLPVQGIGISDVNEAIDDDVFNEVMRQLEAKP